MSDHYLLKIRLVLLIPPETPASVVFALKPVTADENAFAIIARQINSVQDVRTTKPNISDED